MVDVVFRFRSWFVVFVFVFAFVLFKMGFTLREMSGLLSFRRACSGFGGVREK